MKKGRAQDDIPHDGEAIAAAPVFESEGITARDAGEVAGNVQMMWQTV